HHPQVRAGAFFSVVFMKRSTVLLLLAVLLLWASVPTLLTHKAEQALQALNQATSLTRPRDTDTLLLQAQQYSPAEADALTLLNLPKTHTVVFYSNNSQLISIQRMHVRTGDLLDPLAGESWGNALHKVTNYCNREPYQG